MRIKVELEGGQVFEIDADSPEQAQAQALALGNQSGPAESLLKSGTRALDLFNSGMTLGWSDELQGLAGAIPALMPGGESPGEAYRRQRDAVRQSIGQAKSNSPWISAAVEATGGLATGSLVGAALATSQALRAIPGWLRLVLGSGTAGGLAGAGSAPEIEQVPAEAAKGAIIGTLASPLGPIAGRAMAASGRALQTLWRAATEGVDERAQRIMADVLRSSGMDAGTFQARMAELGPDAVLADLNEATQRKLRALAADDPSIATGISELLDTRQQAAAQRLTDAAQEALGAGEIRAGTTLRAIDETRRAAARMDYGPIYDAPIDVDENLAGILQRPSVRIGYNRAQRLAADAGEPMTQFMRNGELIDIPRLADLDHVKQGLDAVIESNTNEFGRVNATGRAARIAKRDLIDAIDAADPDLGEQYRAARSQYAGLSAAQDAFRRGQNIFREDAEWLIDDLAEMGEHEVDMLRQGAFSAVRDEIEGVKRGGSAATRLKLDSPKFLRRLRAAFPGQEQFDSFMRQVDAERQMAATRSLVQGGSPTARIEADVARLGMEQIADVVRPEQSLYGRLEGLANTAWRFGAPEGGQNLQGQALADLLMRRSLPPRAIPQVPTMPMFSPYGGAIGAGAALYGGEDDLAQMEATRQRNLQLPGPGF